MTPEERESLRPESVKSAPSQNLLSAGAAKELAIQHLFEQVSLKRELHIAGMLLRRGIARVSIAEALTWVTSDPFFVRPDPEGKLLTTRQPVRAFSQANEAQFYVSMSRARWAMRVFTDSKVALRDAVTRPSTRLSSWELLDLAEQDRTLKAELARQRAKPKKQQQEIAYER